jgi:type I restriction enzyme S subunit
MAELAIPQRVDILIHHRIENQALREHIRKHGVAWFMRRRAAGTAAMAGEWPIVPVSKLAKAVIGGTPSRNVAEYWHGNIPWATAKDVATVSARYLENVEEYISREALENSAAKLLPYGTVVITARGTVGAMAQLGREMAFNQNCYALLPKGGVDKDFLFYALKGTIAEMRSLTCGTVFETTTTKTFDHWLVPIPPLPEQHAIAHILGTLDDKIELNRRMSETLEAMARALFKAWFVDFEPVRAKMEGRWQRGQSLPGLPAHLYDLFPDRLVDSELGEIPEGWRVVELEQVIEINPPRVLRRGQCAPYLDMASMPTLGHVPLRVVERPYTSGTRFTNGDTLLARITPCLENGKTAFVDFLVPSEVGWGSTEFIVLRPKPPLPAEFGYCLARDPDFREFAIQSMTGTSGRQRVQPEALARYLLVVPSDDVAQAFGALVEPWFRKACVSERESRTLAALRDALLPKLIRGEIRVKDAERFLEERGV